MPMKKGQVFFEWQPNEATIQKFNQTLRLNSTLEQKQPLFTLVYAEGDKQENQVIDKRGKWQTTSGMVYWFDGLH